MSALRDTRVTGRGDASLSNSLALASSTVSENSITRVIFPVNDDDRVLPRRRRTEVGDETSSSADSAHTEAKGALLLDVVGQGTDLALVYGHGAG
jgi:hypothetical protein